MMAASLFCEHKKLRTACATCKATAVPPPSRDLKPVLEEKPKREPKPSHAFDPTDASQMSEDAGPSGRRGPGKPLMPTRQKVKKVGSRVEAEHAEAWWVKK
jgi:hypothetical protein